MRLQLLGLELQQEKERLIAALFAVLIAFLFLSVTLVLSAFAVVVHFWDTPDRLASVVWMAVIAGLITIAAGGFAYLRLSHPSTLFKASLSELVTDEESFSLEDSANVDLTAEESVHGTP
jgi:uncharacterized membrane protein YqjE